MNWCWDGCTFGDYSSYMELAFAINILIAGWGDRFYDKLYSRMKLEGETHDLALTFVKVDMSERNAVEQERDDLEEKMARWVFWLKGFCFALGILIAVALLIIAGRSEIEFWWMPCFLGLPILFLVWVVFLGNRTLKKINEKVKSMVMNVAKEAGKAKELSNI